MKFAAFDLETADLIPEGVHDWNKMGLVGISCAALALSDKKEPLLFYDIPQMTRDSCQRLVRELLTISEHEYTIVTWNGCGFDFAVLAQQSGMYAECTHLAMNHVDIMLIVTFKKGRLLSFEKALEGAELGGKLKTVVLSDGTVFEGMTGAKAPQLWKQGEHEAILAYLRTDVIQLLELVDIVRQQKAIRWTSGSGKSQYVSVDKLLTVRECFDIPEPDVSWMTDPPTREQFINWMQQ